MIANPVNRGYAAAVNQALAAAGADFAAAAQPRRATISGSYADVLAAFRDPRVGAVVPGCSMRTGRCSRTASARRGRST